jgi:low affinity Fe/Cu permease
MQSQSGAPMRPTKSRSAFTRFAKVTSRWSGRPAAFLLACAVVLAWVITGPLFGFSNTWQLAINTTTTIVTFLMVFLIQNTQYRDTEALQIKLDELLRVTPNAHTALLDLEELEDKDLDRLHMEYEEVAERAREKLRRGENDTGTPRV